jgi:hypothetical protein
MTVGSQTKLLKLLLGPQGSGGIAEPQVEFLGHHRLGRATARIDAGEPQQLLEPVRLVENFSANTLVSQTRRWLRAVAKTTVASSPAMARTLPTMVSMHR